MRSRENFNDRYLYSQRALQLSLAGDNVLITQASLMVSNVLTSGQRNVPCRAMRAPTKEGTNVMRGWIILDLLMALTGLVSIMLTRQALGSAISLGILGLLLLMLSLAARIVRGRA